jgi:hypothetical protein
MDIALRTGDDTKTLRFDAITLFHDSLECVLVVQSSGLGSQRRFRFSELAHVISEFERMNANLEGEVRLQEPYWDDFVIFSCDRRGRVIVTGEILNYQDDFTQHLKFGFVTDQTCLGPLIHDLKRLNP